ncbi:MAG: SPOR domain-containing protein [Candidatus Omnitrophica bacterium]|nr:SPOR domain-containing protein [Candidatus Omnitrophota bacterium]
MTIGEDHESQLELFQAPSNREARPAWASAGSVHIRQDHLVLWGIITLIGLSVVFAAGVERGKRIVAAEQLLLGPVSSAPARAAEPVTTSRAESRSKNTEAASAVPASTTPSTAPAAPRSIPRKAAKSIVKTPAKTPAAAASRFAVQVVSYQQPSLAKRELTRLKQQGEPAFLLEGEKATALLIGPFTSKQKAKAKLTNLKTQYHGCFIRSL